MNKTQAVIAGVVALGLAAAVVGVAKRDETPALIGLSCPEKVDTKTASEALKSGRSAKVGTYARVTRFVPDVPELVDEAVASGCKKIECKNSKSKCDAGAVEVEDSPCLVPNCWTRPDGGWDDKAVVDCRVGSPRETGPGANSTAPKWRGCNVIPEHLVPYAVGSQCLQAECRVMSGEAPPKVLR